MHLNRYISKISLIEHWFCHVQPHNQPYGQNVRITFQVKSQGHRLIFLQTVGCR